MSHYTPIDRFTLPRDIPDGARAPILRQAQDQRRGVRVDSRRSVRGELVEPPRRAPQDDRDHLLDYEDDTRHLSHPAGRGWQPVGRQRLPGDPPEPSSVDAFAALLEVEESQHAVFTRALQVRFLDRLAACGNVRAACAAAGVSPHTAYKARRRCAALARLWDAALVLARPHAEAVLAARALDGVEVPIMARGEVVGYRRHYDARLLLAHLGRLDRAAESASEEAQEAAGRFDELLAIHAGAVPDAALEKGDDGALPVPLDEQVCWARGRMWMEIDEEKAVAEPAPRRLTDEEWEAAGCPYEEDDDDLDEEEEAEPLSEEARAALAAEKARLGQAEADRRALWAAWQEQALAAVDAAVAADPHQDGEGGCPRDGGEASPGAADLSGLEEPTVSLHLAAMGGGSPSRGGEDGGSEPCHPVTPLAGPAVPA